MHRQPASLKDLAQPTSLPQVTLKNHHSRLIGLLLRALVLVRSLGLLARIRHFTLARGHARRPNPLAPTLRQALGPAIHLPQVQGPVSLLQPVRELVNRLLRALELAILSQRPLESLHLKAPEREILLLQVPGKLFNLFSSNVS